MTVKEVIAEIEAAKKLIEFMNHKANTTKDEHESDTYSDASDMLCNYVAMLEDMKVRTN